MTGSSHSLSIVLVISLAVSGAYAEDPLMANCNELHNPRFEVRLVSDVPVALFFKYEDKVLRPVPAAGLDLLGLWWAPIRRSCTTTPVQGGGLRYDAGSGPTWYLISSLSLSVLTD